MSSAIFKGRCPQDARVQVFYGTPIARHSVFSSCRRFSPAVGNNEILLILQKDRTFLDAHESMQNPFANAGIFIALTGNDFWYFQQKRNRKCRPSGVWVF